MLLPVRNAKAFTLLELIVVIVILGILAAIAIPTFQKVIGKSQEEATTVSLEALDREAKALAAFRGETIPSADDYAEAAADLNVALAGTHAAGTWEILAPTTVTFTRTHENVKKFHPDAPPVPSTGQAVLAYAADGMSAGLAAVASNGSCVLLVEDGTYETFVKGKLGANCNGSTALAGASSSPTYADAATAPGAPTGVKATSGDAQAVLTWTASEPNGATVTSYEVHSGGAKVASTSGDTTATLTGLTNGTSYTYTVRAVNAAGTSPDSASVTVTPATVPSAPTGVTASVVDASSVSVSFTAPTSNGGSAITGYTVTSSPDGKTTTGTTSPLTVTGLRPDTAYTFSVVATNSVGSSVAATSGSVTTPSTINTTANWLAATVQGQYGMSPWGTNVSGWDDPAAYWIGPNGMTPGGNYNPGTYFAGKKFTTSAATTLTVRVAADDFSDVYLDGVKIFSTHGWTNSNAATVNVAAGEHQLRIAARNDGSTANPTGVMASIKASGSVIVRSDGSGWTVCTTGC